MVFAVDGVDVGVESVVLDVSEWVLSSMRRA